jgi:L-asparaginase II
MNPQWLSGRPEDRVGSRITGQLRSFAPEERRYNGLQFPGKAPMDLSLAARPSVEVPGRAFAGDEPLVAVLRGDHVGSLHRGSFAVVDGAGELILVLGNADERVYLRSAAKPFQVMPAVLAGALDTFGMTEQELAVLCASHSGETRHTEAVLSVLDKAGLGEEALRCGAHPPTHEETARRRWREGREPTAVCNNCSGAHAGMLLACRASGWPIEDYPAPSHPLQVSTRQTLAEFAGVETADIGVAVDSCSVPTFRLPLRHSALAFSRLATGTGVSDQLQMAAGRVVHAMTSHPEMVGGEDRFDSDLMRCTNGTLIAKGGAEGFQGVGVVRRGLGMAMKVSDGNARAIAPATLRILDRLGALSSEQLAALSRYVQPELRSLRDESVGTLLPVFSFGPDG